MPSPNAPDLSGLAQLARDPRLDLRPVLLRVQTDLFVTAPARDREAIAAFESLAGGLLPTVDDATAAIVARKLAACPDAPASLMAALEARGGAVREAVALARAPSPAALAAALSGDTALAQALAGQPDLTTATVERLLALGDPAIDLALAGNRRLPLSPDAVRRLVLKARQRPALAEEVLPRSELTPLDRAALYLHAGVERRARIRAELASVPALAFRRSGPRADAADRRTLLVLAGRGEVQAFERQLETVLACPPQDWRFDDPLRHDLLGFALLAAGVVPDDGILRRADAAREPGAVGRRRVPLRLPWSRYPASRRRSDPGGGSRPEPARAPRRPRARHGSERRIGARGRGRPWRRASARSGPLAAFGLKAGGEPVRYGSVPSFQDRSGGPHGPRSRRATDRGRSALRGTALLHGRGGRAEENRREPTVSRTSSKDGGAVRTGPPSRRAGPP
jgi:hypothetical protein